MIAVTARVDAIARVTDVGRKTEMTIGDIVDEAAIGIFGAGEMIPAIGLADGETILLT